MRKNYELKPDQEALLASYRKESYDLNVIKIPGQGTNYVNTVLPISLIVSNYKLDPTFGTDIDSGVNRSFSKTRSIKLRERILEENCTLPMGFTFVIRNENAFNQIKNGKFEYIPDLHGKLFVSDGQHRTMALALAYIKANEGKQENDLTHEEILKKLDNYHVAATLTFTENKIDEIELLQNTNAYAVPLSIDMKTTNDFKLYAAGDEKAFERAKKDKRFAAMNIAQDIAVDINKDACSVWYNRIKFPNMACDIPNVGNTRMANCINKIKDSQILKAEGKTSKDDIKIFFDAYWEGLKEAYPIFFKNPKEFVIQKSLGADVFMRVHNDVLSWSYVNKKGKLTDPKTYVSAFKRIIDNMSGDYTEGTDFWKSGKSGEAGNYSSEGGKTALSNMMIDALDMGGK